MGRGAVTRQGQRKGDFLAGKYLLEDCLGIGGMGEVYRATNVSLGRKVAIKLLSSKFVHSEEDVLRFLREARAAAAVRHTNVVDVFDVARDDDGTPFIVQELLAGEDLEHYLRSHGGRLSCSEALEIMLPVADAVAAAHAQNVVHRDLKPANIFLSRERNKLTPKVLDFGACLFPTLAERSAKDIQTLIGTPHYMAPEQILSRQDVDARSDVWAIGIILYELIIGETPFEAETVHAVLELVKTRSVPSLRERVKDVPPELDGLVAWCTQRERLKRLANAGEVHQQMLEVRSRMRGGMASSRMETLSEIPMEALPPPSSPTPRSSPQGRLLARHDVPRLDLPEDPPTAVKRAKRARVQSPANDSPMLADFDSDLELTLPSSSKLRSELDVPEDPPTAAKRGKRRKVRSPASEPPAFANFDSDLELPLPSQRPPLRDGASSSRDRPRRGLDDQLGRPARAYGGLDEDEGVPASFDLAARPSSWPPNADSRRLVEAPLSSMPPVLDPRAIDRVPIPSAPLPRELRPEVPQAPAPASAPIPAPRVAPRVDLARPPPVLASSASTAGSTQNPSWTFGESAKFVALVSLPAIVGFVTVLAVPSIGAPLGSALRGDSPLASGVLAVIALIAAAALCARSVLGEQRERSLYVAAAGSVLFGIAMIIVTFAASEAAELGVPSSMSGISTLVAPIAPLALGFGSLIKARETWVDPYSRADAIRFAVLASLMLFLMLALSPVGVVRAGASRSRESSEIGVGVDHEKRTSPDLYRSSGVRSLASSSRGKAPPRSEGGATFFG